MKRALITVATVGILAPTAWVAGARVTTKHRTSRPSHSN
jgi:hypothetical protein